jgi:pantetheine-phosphate adenylyltransferase
MSEGRIAVYAASFDPITNGHLDLVDRALKLFDELIVAVAVNIEKEGLFSIEERLEMVRAAMGDRQRARVDAFDGLLVDFVRRNKAQAVIRGLRALSDFEYEFEMALMNAHMSSDIAHAGARELRSRRQRVRSRARAQAPPPEAPPLILFSQGGDRASAPDGFLRSCRRGGLRTVRCRAL